MLIKKPLPYGRMIHMVTSSPEMGALLSDLSAISEHIHEKRSAVSLEEQKDAIQNKHKHSVPPSVRLALSA